jgi:hypothetical protein
MKLGYVFKLVLHRALFIINIPLCFILLFHLNLTAAGEVLLIAALLAVNICFELSEYSYKKSADERTAYIFLKVDSICYNKHSSSCKT